MVVEVGCWVDVEGCCKFGVSLKLEAFVIAVEDFRGVSW